MWGYKMDCSVNTPKQQRIRTGLISYTVHEASRSLSSKSAPKSFCLYRFWQMLFLAYFASAEDLSSMRPFGFHIQF